jgi:hypothetical protein
MDALHTMGYALWLTWQVVTVPSPSRLQAPGCAPSYEVLIGSLGIHVYEPTAARRRYWDW